MLKSKGFLKALFVALAAPLIFCGHLLLGNLAWAENQDAKASLANQVSLPANAQLRSAPLMLMGGSKLTLIWPEKLSALSEKLSIGLSKTHQFFTDLLGEIPAFTSSIRLIDEETFYLTTGAPRWTNAMYYRGQIIIPLPANEVPDFDNIYRSLKHEYTHAVLNTLSAGKCPGWLDEGLAQWAEGEENPALRPALYDWLSKHKPVGLELLQGGFTKLNSDMVPAAYAQSLFAANTMVKTFGFSQIRHYLDNLRMGQSPQTAFNRAFNLSESAFEEKLGGALLNWHNHQKH